MPSVWPSCILKAFTPTSDRNLYQHCAHNHLHRYLAEFDFRYSNRKALGVEDAQRADKLLKGFADKRLTYETTAI